MNRPNAILGLTRNPLFLVTILRGFLVIVILTAIVTIFWTYAGIGRYAQPGVLTVLPVTNEPIFMFSYDQVWEISADFAGHIEMEQLSTRELTSGTRTVFARASAMGSDNQVILGESLAWALFGSLDVVGLVVHVGNDIFTIGGVVQDAMEPPGHVHGFMQMPFASGQNAAILHFAPDTYNRLQTRLDVERALASINRRAVDYVVFDYNSYTASIYLRGQILLSLSGLVFIFAMLRFAYRITREEQGKRWILASAITAGCILTLLLLQPYMDMDLWLPAFVPEGLQGYAQLLFNSGLDMPRQYLPVNMAVLQDLNARANLGFGVGLVALVGVIAMRRRWNG